MGGEGGGAGLFEEMNSMNDSQDNSGVKKSTLNSELWHACAGPLVLLPQIGGLVYYFPQGHSEQVSVSTKRTGTPYIPSYPNLPSQIMCWVHDVKLHVDKETDEIFSQITLQPVNTDKEIFHPPSFGSSPSKHPNEFFCKTLTVSDTSTHGGFSVPRRAAEKLFPRLDYTMQPPSQEIVVRDLHENMWTFRHIYRGQPKRHLFTTGWSLFVGAKRLKAGDSVLFIRDEKSHLLVGIRRANRQQSALPSSVLTAESMHIGVFAAAAHAFANRSPFTIFYNPRACPSEFVIPLAKYQKALYSAKVSTGMRFGMMFETEESGKRRFMGTISGISDFDSLRWPNSKWRNIQVEWDELGSGEQQNRISLWDMESPEALLIFPSITSNIKRPLHSGFIRGENDLRNIIRGPSIQFANGSNDLLYRQTPILGSEQLKTDFESPPACIFDGTPLQEGQGVSQSLSSHISRFLPSQNYLMQNQKRPKNILDQLHGLDSSTVEDQLPPTLPIMKQEKKFSNPQTLINQLAVLDHETVHAHTGPYIRSSTFQSNQIDPPQIETSNFNYFPPNPCNFSPQLFDFDNWTMQHSSWPSLTELPKSTADMEMVNSILPSFGQDVWEPPTFKLSSPQEDPYNVSSSFGTRDIPEESNDQSEIYNGNQFEAKQNGNNTDHSSISQGALDGFPTLLDAGFRNPSDYLIGNFSPRRNGLSEIATAKLPDSQSFMQEFTDHSGGTSTSNVDFDDSSQLPQGSWQQIPPPLRTFTKVQKQGSVGRSIDVTRFTNYDELRSAIGHMFGLEEVLEDPRSSGWRLVYVDFENDVLLVGDDPWEEFVSCVRCIRVLSPSEAQQMTEDEMCVLQSS